MDTEVKKATLKYAKENEVPDGSALAVVEVESAGHALAHVTGLPMGVGNEVPYVRWEGHYFYKRLIGANLRQAVALGLASPTAGAIKNPATQQERWDKLILPAMKIDADAALESISIGVGQVMGANWKMLGFASVRAMAKRALDGVDGQLDIMFRFIRKQGLIDEMQRGDWKGFARIYNGPGNVATYSALLEAAAKKYGMTKAPVQKRIEASPDVLRPGMNGARVREAQALLIRAGYALELDGDYGPATKRAVEAFQKDHKLTVDGLIGPQTWNALDTLRQTPDETPGQVSPTETPEAKKGGIAALFTVLYTTFVQPIKEMAENVSQVPNLQYILYGAALLVFLGIGVYVGVGAWKARRTT